MPTTSVDCNVTTQGARAQRSCPLDLVPRHPVAMSGGSGRGKEFVLAEHLSHCPLAFDADLLLLRCASSGWRVCLQACAASASGAVTISPAGVAGLWRRFLPHDVGDILRVLSRLAVGSSDMVMQDQAAVLQLRDAARAIDATFFGAFRFDADEGLATLLADTGGVTDEPHASSSEVVAKADDRHPSVCLELWRNPQLSDNALLRVYAWEHAPLYTWYTAARLSAFPDILLITINAKNSVGVRCEVLRYHEVGRGSRLEVAIRQVGQLDGVVSLEPPMMPST